MIPFSVSDIIKLLDEIPIWRNVVALPRKLAALEERVAALEAAKSLPPPAVINPAKACPMCRAEMKITAETAHAQFAFAGVKVHKMKCPSCDYETSRDFRPGKGYS